MTKSKVEFNRLIKSAIKKMSHQSQKHLIFVIFYFDWELNKMHQSQERVNVRILVLTGLQKNIVGIKTKSKKLVSE